MNIPENPGFLNCVVRPCSGIDIISSTLTGKKIMGHHHKLCACPALQKKYLPLITCVKQMFETANGLTVNFCILLTAVAHLKDGGTLTAVVCEFSLYFFKNRERQGSGPCTKIMSSIHHLKCVYNESGLQFRFEPR